MLQRVPIADASAGQDVRLAHTAADFAAARALFEEYAAALKVDLCFQDFAAELGKLDAMYAPPNGCLLLAEDDGRPAACVGIRRFDDTTAELKRLYVQPRCRGRGLGRRLVAEAVGQAQGLGYRRIVLDTLPDMREARALYQSFGFHDIDAYYANPLRGVRYLALDLESP